MTTSARPRVVVSKSGSRDLLGGAQRHRVRWDAFHLNSERTHEAVMDVRKSKL
jgi:hypothetical protein